MDRNLIAEKAANSPAGGKEVSYPGRHGRILLVENRSRRLLRAAGALEGGGYEVDTAVDAAEAMARILSRRPDLILMGTALRGMDGMTLAMHLKAEPATRDIRILAWTAPTANGGAENAAEAGCDGWIAETDDEGALRSGIDPYLDAVHGLAAAGAPAGGGGDSEPGEAPRKGLKILVVDDNILSREMLAIFLNGEGHTVFEASNGFEALALLKEEPMDAVISDALMPKVDGYQLCHTIRGDPRLKELPVIVFSGALISDESALLAAHLGAVRFLRKPAPLDAITATLREVMAETAARRLEAERRAAAETGPAERERRLAEELETQNRKAREMTEKLLQAHHELLVLSCALEQSEKSLREKNERLEEDMRMARETHLALMPRSHPSFPTGTPLDESALRFHQRFTPKGAVSGDFFDYTALSETNAGVFICDVMGHGVGAALVTAVIRGMLVELGRAMSDPSEVLAGLNRVLAPIMRHAGTPMFATAFYMTANAASGEIQYANAGHPNPFLVRRDLGRIERIGAAAHGPALGLLPDARYQTGRRTLARRDLVMLFTDGIFEVDGPDETLFGQERLLGAVRKRIHLPPEQLFDEVMDEVRGYSLTNEFDDDICLLGMEVDHLC